MKFQYVFILSIFFSQIALSHVHGHLKISLALEGKKGLLNIKGSSEVFFGFEHQAKSENDIKKVSETISKLKNILQYVSIDKSFGCSIELKKHEFVKTEKSEHADYELNYDLNCEKSISNTTLNIDLNTLMPNLKEIDFQFISESFQTGQEIEGRAGKIEIK